MRHLLNTLYVQTQGSYLRLENDNVRVDVDGEFKTRLPLHHLDGIVVFGNVLLSPYLIQKLGRSHKPVTWLTEWGQFTARSETPVSGNVLLRVAQHACTCDAARTLAVARFIAAGKLQNQKTTLLRSAREAAGEDAPALRQAARDINAQIAVLPLAETVDEVRGIEGTAARSYFEVFSLMLRANRDFFWLGERTRRPARDPINAVLNYVYTLLAGECASACQAVGLDPQIGFLHALRPGRQSLALDLMEELRPVVADRAVVTLINRQQLTPRDFILHEGRTVTLTEDGRRTILKHLQERKGEEVYHPITGRKTPIGLIPHVQARLLAQHLRGDRPHYPPYLHR
ncbi:CRISPR-associated Cas1 family protein [Deinococcus aerius]|uniref:CRISPR-associated endonuclease Cas1 n=1 Tax=Deinococcus aerius TaxID=200253 RepID=A0A2I9DRW2_9DEIO|nr:type I-C CRISPR-associated endonuclease Cas1c [Deinococcus aerius]GBF08181.1 CRISPR-associated Cas1 family protein [Deinococcus aerius]